MAQQLNPVYTDDSTAASETLARVRELVGSGNVNEAARVLQILLDQEGYRLVGVGAGVAGGGGGGPENLFESVRSAVHRAIRADAALLRAYREQESARAQRMLDEPSGADRAGSLRGIESVWASRALTSAGFEAGLRRAQLQLEDARFEAARWTLAELAEHPDVSGAAGDAGSKSRTDLAELAWRVANYLDRPEVYQWAGGLVQRAGLPSRAPAPVEWPAAARARAATPLEDLGAVNRAGLIARPLWTSEIRTDAPVADEPWRAVRRGRNDANTPASLSDLSLFPAVAGDTVYVNDGTSVQAFDRFTLSARWPNKVTPGVDRPVSDDAEEAVRERAFAGWAQRIEEPASVTFVPGVFAGSPGGGAATSAGTSGASRSDAPASATPGASADNRLNAESQLGGMIIAATGRELSGSRGTDGVISGLDARTGRIVWSVSLSALDPSLADAGARGPIVVSEGRALVACRKFLPERRLTVLILAALDVRTGELVWKRSVGSAGSLPFMTTFTQFDHTLVARGVVYRTDDLGVVGAYRVEDGEPVWLRTLPRQAMQGADSPRAFEVSSPVLDSSNESIVMLTPDRDQVLRLACNDGRVLGRRPAEAFGSPGPVYLMGVGDRLVCVGRTQVSVAPINEFETSTDVRLSPPIAGGGINGRVVAAGPSLLVPTVSGLSVLDLADVRKAAESVALDAPGNVVAIDSQFITIDDEAMHSYLRWDQAEPILTERMRADPLGASPPATLAELAYRADKPSRIAPAVDLAIKALNAAPEREDNRAARRRLFLALAAIINTGLEPETATSVREIGGGEGAANGDKDAAAGRASARAARIDDPALLGALVERLAQVAQGPDERVVQAFAAGRLAERRGRFEEACDQYQQILADEQMALATWEGARVRVRAQVEAARRLAAVVSERGAAVYARHDREAAQAAQALGDRALPGDVRRLAERYPLASVTPALWLRVAMGLATAGDDTSAVSALESGLAAAERLDAPDRATVGMLAGELVTRLHARGQTRAAWRALAGARAAFPNLTLASAGSAVAGGAGTPIPASFESALGEDVAQRFRWPRVGAISPSGVQVLGDGALLEPLLMDREPTTQRMIATASEEEVTLWAVDRLSPDGALKDAWRRKLEGSSAALIRMDGPSAYFLYADRSAGAVEKVTLAEKATPGTSGEAPKALSSWRTQPLAEIFASDTDGGGAGGAGTGPGTGGNARRVSGADRFPVPNEGLYKSDDLLVTLDERTLIVVQRGGRAAGIDCDTGQVLWTLRTGISRVYDVDMAGGVLVVAGDEEVLSGSRVSGLRGAVQVFDARTGATLQRLTDAAEHPRWVRVVDPLGALVAQTFAGPNADAERPRTDDASAPTAEGAGTDAASTTDTASSTGTASPTPRATWASAASTGTAQANISIVVAFDRALAQIDLATGRALWSVQSDEALPATTGWVLNDTLVFQGPDRTLWRVALAEVGGAGGARMRASSDNAVGDASVLDGPRTHLEGVRPMIVLPAAAGADAGFVVSTFQGLLAYQRDGQLGGVDALGGFESVVPPKLATDRALTVETVSEGPTPDGQMVFNLYALEPRGARIIEQTPIVLGARPNAMALLDGRVVLSAGGATVAIQAGVGGK